MWLSFSQKFRVINLFCTKLHLCDVFTKYFAFERKISVFEHCVAVPSNSRLNLIIARAADSSCKLISVLWSWKTPLHPPSPWKGCSGKWNFLTMPSEGPTKIGIWKEEFVAQKDVMYGRNNFQTHQLFYSDPSPKSCSRVMYIHVPCTNYLHTIPT